MIDSATSAGGIGRAGATRSTASDGGVSAPGGKLGKNEFLHLLVTQLRYQDPMNPMDGQRMAADLAQFSGLEQLVNIGDQLKAQQTQNTSIAQSLNNSVAISTIGKTVTAVGDQVHITGAGDETVTARIDGEGKGVLRIYNAAGKEVGSRDLGVVSNGSHTFDLGTAAAGLPPGAYHYQVDVTDSAGKQVQTIPYVTARVDGISYGKEGAMLTAGPLTIAIGTIVKIAP
jgi:flagellar basal-body rod modification protein FlgD